MILELKLFQPRNKEKTKLNKAIFTSLIKIKNVAWSIKADKIEHDKKTNYL